MPKLTKRTVENFKPSTQNFFEWDSELKGFGVRIMPSGRKTFYAQYRSGGVQRRVKLGAFGSITAEEARIEARKVLGDVARGDNPAEEIRYHRRAPTVAEVCERFMTEHVLVRCKPTTQKEYRRSIDLFIKPAMGNRKIADIVRADVSKLHHDLRDKPYQANRTLGVLSKLFNLCEVWGLRPDGSNPRRHVPKYKEVKRERFLSPEEMQRLWSTLDGLDADGSESLAAINALRLLILTGCRLGEIQTLKWSYIDDDYIRLPDSKTGARTIPMTDELRIVLSKIAVEPGNDYVIVGTIEGQHLTDMQRPWRRIRAMAGLDDVRIHDLRHTYASNSIANGLSLEMTGRLLGHTNISTTMRYAHLRDDAIRDAAASVAAGIGSMHMPRPAVQPTANKVPESGVVDLAMYRKAAHKP